MDGSTRVEEIVEWQPSRPLVKNPNIVVGDYSYYSTYPFYILGNGWESMTPQSGDFPYKGDNVIGNDVWLGCDVLVMPGREDR